MEDTYMAGRYPVAHWRLDVGNTGRVALCMGILLAASSIVRSAEGDGLAAGINALLDRCEKAHAAHDLKTIVEECTDDALVAIAMTGQGEGQEAKVITAKQFPADVKDLWEKRGLFSRKFVYRDIFPLSDTVGAARVTAVSYYRNGGVGEETTHSFILACKRDGTWRICLSMPLVFSPAIAVSEVAPGSAADSAGLKVGDEVAICGSIQVGPVGTGEKLGKLSRRGAAAEELALTVVRGKRAIRLTLPGDLGGARLELRLAPRPPAVLSGDREAHPVKLAMRQGLATYAANDAGGFAKILCPSGFLGFEGPGGKPARPVGLEYARTSFAEKVKASAQTFDLPKTRLRFMRTICDGHVAIASGTMELRPKADRKRISAASETYVYVRQGSDWLLAAEIPWRVGLGVPPWTAEAETAEPAGPAKLPWPAAQTAGPRIEAYPCQTAIEGRPFIGEAPRLEGGAGPCRWSIRTGPAGMAIEPATGRPVWPRPIEGHNWVTLRAWNDKGVDEVQWSLHTVRNDIPDAEIVSSRYFDFVVPSAHARLMRLYNVGAFADGYWRFVRDLVGHEPCQGKQVLKFDPIRGGGAVSGNPTYSGPSFFQYDPVNIWALGAMTHEIGHNFLFQTRVTWMIDNNRNNVFYHHGCEFIQQSVALRSLESPERFGLSGAGLLTYREAVRRWQQGNRNRSRNYAEWVAGGGRAEKYEGDYYAPWARMLDDLRIEHGTEVLENTLRAMRIEVLDLDVYKQADTPLKKDTLLQCMFSAGAGKDLRAFFERWGFGVDKAFYDKMKPIVAEALAARPKEDENGWKRCALNGRYYRLTSWPMDWWNAERAAQRMGGHLATVRNEAEARWIRSRFGHRDMLWVGLSDRQEEGKLRWTSGEQVREVSKLMGGANTGGPDRNACSYHPYHPREGQFIDIFPGHMHCLGLVEAAKPIPDETEPAAGDVAPAKITPRNVALPNPSFERPLGEVAGGWQQTKGRRKCRISHAPDAHVGRQCIRIDCGQAVAGSISLTVAVKKHHLYRLAGYIRTKDVPGAGAGAMLKVQGAPIRTDALHGTCDWTLLETVFDSADRDEIRIDCLLDGSGSPAGDAWYDDVTLEEICESPTFDRL